MEDYKFKFSVVMPVYDVEQYLEESILSLVNQTIGFKENIQLIFVNDGSPDNSGDICIKYKQLYPDNVVYIEQENAGVSAARNRGLEAVEGKYVNFLDSDDMWEENVFETVFDFFEQNEKLTDVVTAGIRVFEAVNKPHITNYRLKNGTRIADLLKVEEADSIVLQVASSFFKEKAIRNVRFKEGLRYGEDSLFANTVIMKRLTVGFVAEVNYCYRRRNAGTSTVQTIKQTEYYYIERLRDYLLELISLAMEKFGCVPAYIQNVVYYDFGWHLMSPAYRELDEEGMKQFLELSKEILGYIDDNVILNNTIHKSFIKKKTAFRLKYDTDLGSLCRYDGSRKAICYQDKVIFGFERNRFLLVVHFCSIKNKKLVIEGLITKWLFELTAKKVKFVFKAGENEYTPKYRSFVHKTYEDCFGKHEQYRRFYCEIPLEELSYDEEGLLRIRPVVKFGKQSCRTGYNYAKFVATSNAFVPSYKFYGNYYMKCFRTVIHIGEAQSRAEKLKLMLNFENECQKWLRKNGKNDIAALRRKYFAYKITHRNAPKIWIVSDRVENAGDNGEVFFKYINKIKNETEELRNVRPIFAISKKAACVNRLKSEGEVVFIEDKKFPLYFLMADKVISSGASDFTMNPFGKDRRFLIDLFNFKYYYLQHGVACADLSVWLNRFYKNIEMIFATSERERDSFVNDNYYYPESKVAIAGQARFDDLYVNTEKQILVLPTWRKSIKESYDENTTSIYFDGFKDTEYFKYYNGLINNERLLDAMRKYGYKGLFCIHPIHMKQTVDFDENDVFRVNEGYVDYNDVFARSAMMVTDYSSVLFDFAYLRKPVVYTHFDKEEFFAGQIYDEGYFSYENDGFGPVCYDLDSTVDAIIASIERDCKNEQKYLDRIDNFYAYSDTNNCERIYQAIKKNG
ncbi:MAG: CDP-glycerol glycerophosphotransferase family protein [Clostridia bacterium]|nr:CDP-glycerol glycerophosphotransferase family protein [Clostridia bacterium]